MRVWRRNKLNHGKQKDLPATGRIGRKELCGCRYVAFFQCHLTLSFAICLSEVMCCRLVVLVTRNLEAAALYVTSVRNALATIVPGNERQKERVFSVPSAARREQGNNGRKSTGISPGDHMSYIA